MVRNWLSYSNYHQEINFRMIVPIFVQLSKLHRFKYFQELIFLHSILLKVKKNIFTKNKGVNLSSANFQDYK